LVVDLLVSEYSLMPHLTKSIEVVFTANHLTDTHIGLCSVLRPRQHSIGYMGDGFFRYWQTKLYRKSTQTKYNPKRKQRKIQQNKTTLLQSPLTTLGQETRWAYSTSLPCIHI